MSDDAPGGRDVWCRRCDQASILFDRIVYGNSYSTSDCAKCCPEGEQ